MIAVEHLTKSFRQKWFKKLVAVNDVSFHVNDGEVVGLLGANGAGKTTIMRLLATMLRPQRGTICIGGYDVQTEPQQVRNIIGILPELWGLYERFTPREHLKMFGAFYGMDEARLEKRIEELIAVLDMEEFADRPCKRFSKGMSRKVALARMLIHDPSHLLLDEPTTGLDVMSVRLVRRLIAHGRAQGKCIILSTHILSEAERLCDRLILLDAGKLIAEGTVAELCQRSGKDTLEDAFVTLLGREDVEVLV
ncbi:MAG: ATP-binding cassette domain-containing protein [Anaerolineales bacterium]